MIRSLPSIARPSSKVRKPSARPGCLLELQASGRLGQKCAYTLYVFFKKHRRMWELAYIAVLNMREVHKGPRHAI